MNRIHTGKLMTGLLLIAAGTLFLFEQLGYGNAGIIIENYWPMFIVAIGASRLGQRPWSGIWMIIVGLWLQATTLHLWGLTFHTSWPLLLIAMGAAMVVRTFLPGEARNER
jgi:hypothetical protein